MTTTWQRFDLPTGTNANGLTLLDLGLGSSSNSQFTSSNPIYIWGAQMEMGSSPGAVNETGNTGTTGGTLAANGLNESYSYDAFGNMLSAGNFNFVQSYTTANQLSGWVYDAAGDLLNDGLGGIYTYDAEGRISTVSGNSYVYDADGNRVEKSGSSATDYISFGGKQLARLSGGQWTDLIYGVGGLLAEVPGTQTGAPVYRMVDHLGSVVGTLDSSGNVLSSLDYAPFGQIFAGGTADPYVFTGKERDAESGLDYFGARYYASSMGRFMSPDWSSGPDTVPSARWSDPQSLNLYSYGRNNPLSNIDPDGHDYAQYCPAGGGACTNIELGVWNNAVAAQNQQNANGTGGNITVSSDGTVNCGGTACGTVTFHNTPLQDEGGDTLVLAIPVERLAGPALSAISKGISSLFGRAAAKGAAEAAPTILSKMPDWVRSGGAFVNWLKQLSHNGVKLTEADADAIASQAKVFNVDVRLDPPHPGTNWEVPHLNIGQEGQVHLEVPQGYDNPSLPKGSARKP